MKNNFKTIILICLLVFSIFLVGCQETSENIEVTDKKDVAETKNVDNKDLSQRDLYAKFEAKMACRLYEAGKSDDPNEVMAAMASIKDLAEEFGYTEEELTSNTYLYKDDPEFKELASKLAMEMCPGISN